MNFGWTAPFGMFGSGGGVKKPANPNDILQWLTAYTGTFDAEFTDKVVPRLDSPVLEGVSCLEMAGGASDLGLTFPDDVELNFNEQWVLQFTINPDANADRILMSRTNTSGVGSISPVAVSSLKSQMMEVREHSRPRHTRFLLAQLPK